MSVKKMGSHIKNSPFKINVGEREVGDAKKVKVEGAALKDGKTHDENTFTVDTRDAGKVANQVHCCNHLSKEIPIGTYSL